jgi:Legionella pneumophila major outer membrane protein precursor
VAQVPPVAQAPLEDYCDGGPYWTWIAAVEATYLRPEFLGDNNVSFENNVSIDSNDFDHDYGAAPRVWVGVENPNGWGVRARYWDFTSADAAVNEFDFVNQVEVEGASVVEAYTIDLEVTKRLCTPTWTFLGGLGARYAEIRHYEQLSVFDSDNFAVSHAAIGRQTRGTGLTGMLEATRPFGNRGLSLYGNIRGSVLWGNTDANSSSQLTVVNSGASSSIFSTNGVDETLSIVETQVGVEWSHDLACCRGLVFARALVEYQIWTTDEDPLQDQSNFRDDFSNRTINATSDTAFYGLAFTIGIAH